MPSSRLLLLIIPLVALVLFSVAIWLMGNYSSFGFARFSSVEFWSFYAATIGFSLFISLIVGVMATDNPRQPDPIATMFITGLAILFTFTFFGLFPAYFLEMPKPWFLRVIAGGIGFPIALMFVVSILGGVSSLFIP